jgi:succinate dehydrogenase/fumarate reductase flavoprotein subunit
MIDLNWPRKGIFMERDKQLSRRVFLASAATGATALAGLPGRAQAQAVAQEIEWDREFDVVVVGYGGAGAAAAIAAHDAGASVLIVEKTGQGGGSTYYSGGFFVSPRDAEGAVDYLMGCARAANGHHFDIDRESLTAWAEEAMHNADWIEELGGDPFVTLRGWYDFPGAASYTTWQPRPDTTGVGLWRVLSEAVEARGIEVVYDAGGSHLVTRTVEHEDGIPGAEVLGVVAAGAAGRTAVRAARGVILTCGGFDFDETLKMSYMRSYPIYSTGHPGNTGDAIRLAAGAGAALWRLTGTSANLCHKFPEVEVAYPSNLQLSASARSMIMVDQRGRRFVNEALNYDAVAKTLDNFDAASLGFNNSPCWCIFDDKARQAGPAGLPVPIGNPTYTWSADNSEEIAKGWILQADTLSGLADQIGVDAATLEQTVADYNAHVAQESDPDFGRAMGLIAIEGPPYYALKGYPGLWATGGGPRINTGAHVLDTHDRVIPRLYVAGSASSFCFSHLYPLSGTAIGDCFAMGRIAGRNASSEQAW